MRKQYHLRPSSDGDGFDAWDVDRLIELADSLAPDEIEVASISELDETFWFQPGQGVEPTVRAIVEHVGLVNAVDLRFPIILGPDGRVLDGMHRVARSVLDGNRTIAAVRLPELPPPDHRNCDPAELSYTRE